MTTSVLMSIIVAMATILSCCQAGSRLPCSMCDLKFEKVGCYVDEKDRALPQELVQNRDPEGAVYITPELDWKKFGSSVRSLACHCAEKANEKGYKVFGLQFYGECWGGPGGENTYAKYGLADRKQCYQDIYSPTDVHCDKNKGQECIGGDLTNYVYRLIPEALPTPTPGFTYSEWSEWSSCSKTCAGGKRTREKTCISSKAGRCDTVPPIVLDGACNVFDCYTKPLPTPTPGFTYSEWSEWSSCSKTCGGGKRTREKICNSSKAGRCDTVPPIVLDGACNEFDCYTSY